MPSHRATRPRSSRLAPFVALALVAVLPAAPLAAQTAAARAPAPGPSAGSLPRRLTYRTLTHGMTFEALVEALGSSARRAEACGVTVIVRPLYHCKVVGAFVGDSTNVEASLFSPPEDSLGPSADLVLLHEFPTLQAADDALAAVMRNWQDAYPQDMRVRPDHIDLRDVPVQCRAQVGMITPSLEASAYLVCPPRPSRYQPYRLAVSIFSPDARRRE